MPTLGSGVLWECYVGVHPAGVDHSIFCVTRAMWEIRVESRVAHSGASLFQEFGKFVGPLLEYL